MSASAECRHWPRQGSPGVVAVMASGKGRPNALRPSPGRPGCAAQHRAATARTSSPRGLLTCLQDESNGHDGGDEQMSGAK